MAKVNEQSDLHINQARVTMPRWLLVGIVSSAFVIGCTWVEMYSVQERVNKLEVAQMQTQSSLARMEKIMCRICVGTLGESACAGPCN